jgi:hypothetical protein
MARTLDRLVSFDERSKNFPIRALVGSPTPISKVWDCKYFLDQGSEGACVGFGWAHELGAAPVKTPVSNATGFGIYNEAKKVDEWAGENYEGTSVIAGAKVVQGLGFMPEYRWAFNLNDVIITLGYHGPIVLGCDWYEGMWDTDSKGFIHPTGNIVGGHCVLIRGVAVAKKYLRIRNSWGQSWGSNGDAKISYTDFAKLMSTGTDLCVPVIRR